MTQKTIMSWTSKVQFKKCTPYIALIKQIGKQYNICKGNEVNCHLIIHNGKLKVMIDVE